MENKIKNFELRYDGMYHIKWSEGNKTNQWYIYLSISELLKMIEIEGITTQEIIEAESNYKPIIFNKVVLSYTKEDDSHHVYGFFDESYENTLTENFIIELFEGDSLKNYKNRTLLGLIEIDGDNYENELS